MFEKREFSEWEGGMAVWYIYLNRESQERGAGLHAWGKGGLGDKLFVKCSDMALMVVSSCRNCCLCV